MSGGADLAPSRSCSSLSDSSPSNSDNPDNSERYSSSLNDKGRESSDFENSGLDLLLFMGGNNSLPLFLP